MLSLNLHYLLDSKGIERHNLFLHKLGIGRATASNLLHHNFTYLNTVHLSKICLALNCTPSDLFTWIDSETAPLPEGHSLQKLKANNNKPIAARIRNLSADKISQLNSFLEDLEKN